MNDIDLVQACLRGDVASQRELFRQHRATLRKTLGCCGFSPADVAELEQRVWIRLLGPRKVLASFSGQGSLTSWLRRVALNEARSEMRRRHRRSAHERLDETHDSASGGHDPEHRVIKNEKRMLLESALEDVLLSLDPLERGLLMAWAEGASTDALAATRGVHRSSVSRRLGKLRRRVGARLRDALWEHYGRATSEISLTTFTGLRSLRESDRVEAAVIAGRSLGCSCDSPASRRIDPCPRAR